MRGSGGVLPELESIGRVGLAVYSVVSWYRGEGTVCQAEGTAWPKPRGRSWPVGLECRAGVGRGGSWAGLHRVLYVSLVGFGNL